MLDGIDISIYLALLYFTVLYLILLRGKGYWGLSIAMVL